MRIVSLGSGSKGNAYAVEAQGEILLIDCGLTFAELRRRSALAGFELSRVTAVVITHEHNDHVAGLKCFHRKFPAATLFANLMTSESVAVRTEVPEEDFVCFENGQSFEVGPFTVAAFSIPHDTSDPVGYLVKADGVTYFHGTDIGTPLDSIGLKLSEADIATLESNHDPILLRTSGRPPCLIQRIAGVRGHLSNDQSAELVRRFASPRLRYLALAHLSEHCNAPHLAEGVIRDVLREMNRTDIRLAILPQNDIQPYCCDGL